MGSDSANAMRALFGLEEEETERSMLGGKGIKGMLGSKTAYLSRSALPKDVDNPKKLRTLSSRMQNAFPKSKKDPVVKYFGGEKKIVWESKGLKGSDSGGLSGASAASRERAGTWLSTLV